MYTEYIFGTNNNHVRIHARNTGYAIQKFKVQELWPELYVDRKYIKKEGRYEIWNDNDAGVRVPETAAGAVIYIYTENETSKKKWYQMKPIGRVSLDECINVNYRTDPDAKLLPAQHIQGNEITAPARNNKIMDNKIQAREYMASIEVMKKELEKKINDLNEQVEYFEKNIEEKLKQIFVMETYLGAYEDIIQLQAGSAASEDEPICVYQQKCFMDEETGLTEIDNSKYNQGLDYTDIAVFDKWIVKKYKRYLYGEKGVMAWQVRRAEKKYGDAFTDMIAKSENSRTYFLIRNGENLYRIYSNVHTPDSMFPAQKELEHEWEEARKWDNIEKYRHFIEKHLYILIALQGIADRTDILGRGLRGKVDLIRPTMLDERYIKLIRDDEPEYWLGDGKKSWREYLEDNQNTIGAGSRVVINKTFTGYDNERNYNVQGNVYIVESIDYYAPRKTALQLSGCWNPLIDFFTKYNNKTVNQKTRLQFEKSFGCLFDISIEECWRNNKRQKYLSLRYDGYRIIDDQNKYSKLMIHDNTLVSEYIIKGLQESKKHYSKYLNDISNYDKIKILYHSDETVYTNWYRDAHERKNRKSYFINRENCINIDEVSIDDIRYYMNNRRYRKDYLKLISFLKMVYRYKKEEEKTEEPFITLLSHKSGIADIEKIKSLMKWWKIKNKWKRFLNTDEDKAYRMILKKLTVSKEN